jgi:hypothetical protein
MDIVEHRNDRKRVCLVTKHHETDNDCDHGQNKTDHKTGLVWDIPVQIPTVADLDRGKKHHAPKLPDGLAKYQAEIRADRKEKAGYHEPRIFPVADQAVEEAKDNGKKADPAKQVTAGGQDEDI